MLIVAVHLQLAVHSKLDCWYDTLLATACTTVQEQQDNLNLTVVIITVSY
jgi:hypothetical protein